VQEPDQRVPDSRRADPAVTDAPRHRAPGGDADTGELTVVTPTGQPGQSDPRPTTTRVERNRSSRRTRRQWYAVGATAALVVLVIAAVAMLRHAAPKSDLADSDATTPASNFSDPDAGTLPPSPGQFPLDLSSPSPGAGLPGDGAPLPTAPAAAPPPVVAPPATARTYSAVSGESCEQKADHGFFRKGFASDWRTSAKGGWTGDGCRGGVVSVPMSGDARRDDNDNVIVWWFLTGAVKSGSCSVSIYVPDTGRSSDSAGKPAHYVVYGSSDASGAPIGQFDIDQTRNRGRFVDGGRFTLSGSGRLSVRMVTRGVDFGSGREDAHLGVSALRLTCAAG
jgi:hypothetical protein